MHPYAKLALSAVVVVPLGLYGGTALKELQLSRSMASSPEGNAEFDRPTMARIVQLAQERQHVLQMRDQINEKILVAERRLELERKQAGQA